MSSPAKIPQVDVKLELGDPPTREEIQKATMQLKVVESPGIDGIQAEDGIRDVVLSRGLGDVYKRQATGEQILELIEHCFSPVLIHFCWNAINAR